MMRVTAIAAAFVFLTSPAFAQSAVEKGKEVYAAQKCSICHSIAGVGNKKGPLDDVGKMSAGDIRNWIVDAPTMATKAKSDRKPAMKAYNTLSKDDVDALVAYLSSLKK